MKPVDTSVPIERRITIVLAVVIFFLVSRFFFQFAGVSSDLGFVGFVYQVSTLFLLPFQNPQPSQPIQDGSVLDLSPLFAAFIYTLFFQLISTVATIIYSYIKESNQEALSHSHTSQTPQG